MGSVKAALPTPTNWRLPDVYSHITKLSGTRPSHAVQEDLGSRLAIIVGDW